MTNLEKDKPSWDDCEEGPLGLAAPCDIHIDAEDVKRKEPEEDLIYICPKDVEQ